MKALFKKKSVIYLFLVGAFVGCQKSEIVVNDKTSTILSNPQNTEVTEFIHYTIEGEYIVVMKEEKFKNTNPEMRLEMVQERINNFCVMAKIDKLDIKNVYSNGIQGFAAKLNADQLKDVMADDEVKYIEPNQGVLLGNGGNGNGGNGNGGNGNGGNGGGPPPQVVSYGTVRVNGTSYNGSKKAWIIDSGIDLDHPDLNVDVANSYSVFNNGPDATPDDKHGHGTHVAGIVGAIDNTIGTKGVAAGASLVAVKAFDRNGNSSIAYALEAIDYVVNNATVGDGMNMSWNFLPSQALDDAVLAAGTAGFNICIASGNASQDVDWSPGRVNGPNIYTLSAIDDVDVFTTFSNFGSEIDYATPGNEIYSTSKSGGYLTRSGTSMAAPHLLGVLLHGAIVTDGFAINDPDGNPDPIGVH